MEKVAAEWNYHFTYEVMAEKVKEVTGAGSVGTIWRIIREEEWARVRQVCRPTLTEEQMRARLVFAIMWCDLNWHDPTVLIVHIDEKMFYAFRTGKVLYVPPGVEPPIQHVSSKTQIPHVSSTCYAGLTTSTGHVPCRRRCTDPRL